MYATARESLLSQAVAYITIHLRNAFTQNSRQRILGALPEHTLFIADSYD